MTTPTEQAGPGGQGRPDHSTNATTNGIPESTSPTGPTLATAALGYAKHGWHVFPLRPGTKDGYYHPSWKRQATNDLDTVARWWEKWPDANIGCPVGPSGIAVVDQDHGSTVEEFLRRGLMLPATLTSITPNGGAQYFYEAPPWPLGNHAGYLPGLGKMPNWDVRGDGGYVLLPPSELVIRRPRGRRPRRRELRRQYVWLHRQMGSPDWRRQPVPWPSWLREAPPRPQVRRPRRGFDWGPYKGGGGPERRLEGLCQKVRTAKKPAGKAKGERNAVLNWAAYKAREIIGELGQDRVARALLDAALAAGLKDTEARKTIASGLGVAA